MTRVLKIPIESLERLHEYIPDNCTQLTAVRVKKRWVVSIPKASYPE